MKCTRMKMIALALMLGMLLSACGQKDNAGTDAVNNPSKEKIIVTSFYPMYIFTKNIARDIPGVKVVNMTEPQQGCLHDYQLTPADMKMLEDAQILVINGAGMESFMDKVIRQMPELQIVEASKGMKLLRADQGHSEHEDLLDETQPAEEKPEEVNPHVWVSISGAIQEVKNIGAQLSLLDPDHAEKYEENTEEYVGRLEALKEKMHNTLKNITTKSIVTFHEAFPYFAEEFDLDVIAVIEREPGSDPGAGELAETVEKIKQAGKAVLFAEPQYSQKAADTIAAETGAKVYILDPVATGPKEADADAYEKAMESNLTTLLEALS